MKYGARSRLGGVGNRAGAWAVWAAWGDYDADGRLDVAGAGATGNWWLLHSGSSGSYDSVPGMSGGDTWPYGRGDVAWADYDNDGDLDLLMGGYAQGFAWFFRNDGGVFTKMTSDEVGSVVTDPPSFDGVVWGDYDNDGDLDLYVARWIENSSDEVNYLYENEGDGTLRRVRIGSPTTSINSNFAAYWVDYDRDGFLDLYVPALANPPTHLFHNELGQLGNRNGWLQVRCEGRVTNRDGIGAMVRVKARIGAAERWQMRQIASSCTGQPLVAHFGLGDATNVMALRVEWPSGAVQEYKEMAVNQSLVLKEPTRLVPTGPAAFEVKSWPGMEFTVEFSLDLETWSAVGSVTNVNGTATFTDAAGAQGTCRFYRVVEE